MASCGPSFRLEPLAGDDPKALEVIEFNELEEGLEGPMAAARALRDALADGNAGAAWRLLSNETRQDLEKLAAAAGKSCPAVLSEALSPAPDGSALAEGDWVAWFFIDDLVRIDPALGEREPREQSEGRATIFAVDHADRAAPVQLRYEGGGWRVHRPVKKG